MREYSEAKNSMFLVKVENVRCSVSCLKKESALRIVFFCVCENSDETALLWSMEKIVEGIEPTSPSLTVIECDVAAFAAAWSPQAVYFP
jgi:hypothetical protein